LHFRYFSLFFVSDVSVDHSSDVMACSTATYERIFDVAAIIADRTSIWTSFGLASYMVFFSFDHAVYINTNIVAVYLIVSGSSCSTRPTARSHHAFAFGLRTHDGAHRSFDFPISFGTHRSTCLAFSSDSISYIDSTTYIDYATDTFAKFSLPTSSHSTSITNGRIDGLSR